MSTIINEHYTRPISEITIQSRLYSGSLARTYFSE
jgi:hypothetical protein